MFSIIFTVESFEKKIEMYNFEGESPIKYVLYTYENIEICGRPLIDI